MASHLCNHCGTPTKGAFYCRDMDRDIRLEMCQACWDYIGSNAARQEGATMNNRIEMERKYRERENS